MKWLLAACGLAVTASTCAAGKTTFWRQESPEAFRKGKLTRLVVTSEGQVRLSRQLRSLADAGAAHVWEIAFDAKQNLLAATGTPGQLIRIDPQGNRKQLLDNKDAQIFAIAVADDGTVYAGISPGGTIVRLKEGGESEALFATGETYVWALAVDGARNVYAATGPHGKLFVVSPDGKGKVLFQAKQSHLLSMALASSGLCYIGTDAEGLIYRISPDGKAYVAYDATQSDIQTLLLTPDGTLYAGTGTPARPMLPGGPARSAPRSLTTSSSSQLATQIANDDDPAAKATTATPTATGSTTDSGSSRSPGTPTATGMTKAANGENSVFRIDPDGAVDEIFRESSLVLSLAVQQDRLLVGTGQEGRLYEVDLKSRAQSEIARLEHGQINAMASTPQGEVVIAAGTPGAVYTLDGRFAASGVFLSEILDAKIQSRWGKAVWNCDVPAGSELEMKVRTGNVGEPDETWSEWSTQAEILPLGRFFQYQAAFKSPEGKSTPALLDFTLYYATVNRSPKVSEIVVPNLEKSPATDPGEKLKFTWKATDPNSDTLTYRLHARKDGWNDWVQLAKDLTKTEFEWDPGSMPGGRYRIRVTASDHASNRAEQALTDQKTSEAFVLDRQAPAVKILVVKKIGNKLEVQCTATDTQTRLTSAAYAVNGGEWINLFPNDGLFDSLTEQITFLTDDLAPGMHVLVVRFQDSAGHIGVADTVVAVGNNDRSPN